MKKEVFYGKVTISSFVILTILGLWGISFITQFGMVGGGGAGFPIPYSHYNTAGPPEITPGNWFSYTNLIGDLIIYYIVAVLISLGFLKLKKQKTR